MWERTLSSVVRQLYCLRQTKLQVVAWIFLLLFFAVAVVAKVKELSFDYGRQTTVLTTVHCVYKTHTHRTALM